MANIYLAIAVPAGAGVGANTNVSAMGKAKTITVVGTFTGSITVEFALDAAGTVFCPVRTFTFPTSDLTVNLAARFMRVRRSGAVITGTPVVNVASDDAAAQFVSLPVPAGTGVGGSTSVVALGTFNTILVGGAAFGGSVIIEISVDGGTTWSQFRGFQPGGGCFSANMVAGFMRVRRINATGGTPTVDVAAINDPLTSSSGEAGRYAIPEKWGQDDVAAAQTAVALSQRVSTVFANDTKMVRAGSLTGLNTRLNTPITAGTLTVIVTVGGVATTLTLVHTSASNPSGGQATLASAVEAFAAGALVGIDITTSAGFLPVTADLECWLEIDS